MKFSIFCIGKLRKCPEKEIFQKYVLRFNELGKQLNFKFDKLIEIDSKKFPYKKNQSKKIEVSIPNGAYTILLDEKGEQLDSVSFASFIMQLRNKGEKDVAFMIGGADGVAEALKDESDTIISLGKMVWPHVLVRIMLIEQLYRSASILTSKPYHRL